MAGCHGVRQDLAKAVEFRTRAASQGHALSQHRLGMMYWGGQGVPQSNEQCRELWRSAALAGLAAAQFSLAMCFANGYVGLDRDDGEAERGCLDCNVFPSTLGVIRSEGEGGTSLLLPEPDAETQDMLQ